MVPRLSNSVGVARLGVLCLTLVAGQAVASDYFVAQKPPAADDGNPGTEAQPLKTISAAVKRAQPGDTIWVKEGDYDDRVVIDKPATAIQPIVLSAWKDDRVRIGYQPRPLPVQGDWQRIPGSQSWQIKLTEDVPQDFLLLLDGKAILTWTQDGPPRDEKVNWAAYRRSDRTLMFNAKGKDPGRLGKFQYGRRPSCFSFMVIQSPAAWWIVRKIEFSWVGVGMYLCGDNCKIEDCYFTHCYRGGMFTGGRTNIIRRCNFFRCGNAMHGVGGVGFIIEDNLIVDCSLAVEDDIVPLDIPESMVEGYSATCFKGDMLSMLFMYNIMSENHGDGWYADCANAQSARVIGNAFWDNGGQGIFNVAFVNDSVAQGNLFYRNSAVSSASTRWNLIDNLFFEGSVCWNNLDINPMRDGYMLLRRNAFVNPHNGYLSAFASGWGQYAWPEVFRNCMVDHNRIWLAKDGLLVNDDGARKYKTLDEVRKEFKWELNGEVLSYQKEKDTVEAAARAMGGNVVTFRVPWGKHSGEARPMLASVRGSCHWPGAVFSTDTCVCPCYFWRVADGNYNSDPLLGNYASYAYHSHWLVHGNIDPSSARHGCIWYCDAEGKFPPDLETKTPCRKGHLHEWNTKMAYTEGNSWLVMEGVNAEKMLPQGVGYWTPTLGAAPGAKITVSLKMRGKDLVSSESGSPAVWLQFTNETGQHRQQVFLVGKDGQGEMHRPDLAHGSYPWKGVKETITAPANAVRMALFFGLQPCKGKVEYDGITIKTADAP
jgi:hypothetical protein